MRDVLQALEQEVRDVVVPESVLAACSGKALASRLGLRPGGRLLVVYHPTSFEQVRADLAEQQLKAVTAGEKVEVVLSFVDDPGQLQAEMAALVNMSQHAAVWIAWKKGGSAKQGELTQQVVRSSAMAAGLVEYQICSLDARWSALLFKWRGRHSDTKTGK